MHDYDAYCDKPGKLHLPELGYRLYNKSFWRILLILVPCLRYCKHTCGRLVTIPISVTKSRLVYRMRFESRWIRSMSCSQANLTVYITKKRLCRLIRRISYTHWSIGRERITYRCPYIWKPSKSDPTGNIVCSSIKLSNVSPVLLKHSMHLSIALVTTWSSASLECPWSFFISAISFVILLMPSWRSSGESWFWAS